jgi:hypothetical protein
MSLKLILMAALALRADRETGALSLEILMENRLVQVQVISLKLMMCCKLKL